MTSTGELQGQTALVTGANGFVGQAVVRRLLAQGDSVIAAVGPGAAGAASMGPKLTNVSLDLANDVSIRDAVSTSVDAVSLDARNGAAWSWHSTTIPAGRHNSQ